MRLLRATAALLELGLVVWSLYQVAMLARELLTYLATLVRADPERGFSAGGPTYPNTYGIRLEPLTPDELEAALHDERTIARRLAELVGEPVGSASPAASASTPSAAGTSHQSTVSAARGRCRF